ncbi:solute carrier organic anion transporter family member 4A1-like [Dendronephthya gigantea]|uniref:solute carrier organic anion transporter family member 4A1-like n=1 Tax=Dendronephthya gigantea TaxID=151771 RepID=UPI00106BCD59|nr:solute carrier organic anion transporter family member 4A1-like [Dendronephthya gigantea]XP_028391407.1 solute carrier organic anion transporter family member 4A1-like [Dendronephthya gigantea]XP_028391408.1 solute carrier organic anion transporter family member 4A1-like [Dendronephthya gigantea]
MEEEDSEYVDLRCGWRSWKPKFMQQFNSPKWFLFFFTVFSCVQGMIISGFTAAGLTSMERRFQLSSKQAGMIVAAHDVSSLVFVVFVSYYGETRHKAKWIGIGALVTSIGCLLFALPHVLAGKYSPNERVGSSLEDALCSPTSRNQTTTCENLSASEWKYMFVFIGAKLVLGVGMTPAFTLGPAYIDENVSPEVAPMYIGVWFIATFFGPGVGYLAGGTLMNIYVDLIQPPDMDLTPSDPRWVGAWWLGYVCGGTILLLTSLLILAYPREMPGTKQIRAKAVRDGKVKEKNQNLHGRMSEIIPATKYLICNAVYMCNTLALTGTGLVVQGLAPFISKFLQSQFGANTADAGIFAGVVIIPGTAGGIILGSYLIKRLDQRIVCKHAAKYCVIFSFVGIFGTLTFLIPGCQTTVIAGVNTPYPDSSSLQNMSSCYSPCHCEKKQYIPTCGRNNITYYDPCHAGCSLLFPNKTYSNCRCVAQAMNASVFESTAKPGICDKKCKNLVPFLFGAFVLLFTNFIVATPNKTVVLRSVPYNLRSYALGFQWLIMSSLGSMPGPVLFGAFIDKTCNLWEKRCDETGACLEYNNSQLSYLILAAGLLFQVLATILYFLSWYFCKSNKPLECGEKSVVTADEGVADWELQRIQEARNTGSPLIQVRGLATNDDKDIRASQLSLVSLTAQGMGNVARYPSMTLDDKL